MGKDEKNLREERAKARKEEQELLGFSPETAAISSYLGGTGLASVGIIPPISALAGLSQTGRPIKNMAQKDGLPVSEIADFTRREARAIAAFAREHKVKVPIVAAPGDYFMDIVEPLRYKALRKIRSLIKNKKIRKVIGEVPRPSTDMVPHIGLRTTSLPTAFHEIGHASPVLGSHGARRAWQRLSHASKGMPGTLAQLGIIGATALPSNADESTLRKKVREHAPALVGATAAPFLLEESRATGKALLGGRKHGVKALTTLKDMGPATGTYFGRMAAMVLGALLAQRVGSAVRDATQYRKEKTAAELKEVVKPPGALRIPAQAAWRMGTTVPRPHTTPIEKKAVVAAQTPVARLPSKNPFYKDMVKSLYNPQRGFRMAIKPG